MFCRTGAQTEPIVLYGRCTNIEGISVRGTGKNQPGFKSIARSSGGGQGILTNCNASNCSNGIDASYTSTVAFLCNLHENGLNGTLNFVDGKVIANIINSNDANGSLQQAGANDTVFFGNKLEYNDQHNLNFSGAAGAASSVSNNVAVVNILDRAGFSGFSANYSNGCIFAGNILRRNGRLSELDAANDAHFKLSNNTKLLLAANMTKSGAGDAGGSDTYNSPRYTITGGTNVSVYLQSGDMSGFVTTVTDGLVSGIVTTPIIGYP